MGRRTAVGTVDRPCQASPSPQTLGMRDLRTSMQTEHEHGTRGGWAYARQCLDSATVEAVGRRLILLHCRLSLTLRPTVHPTTW